jgi:hypothetical protein
MIVLCVGLVSVAGAGCASLNRLAPVSWSADYDTAEARAQKTGREILIHYRDTRPGVEDRTSSALRDSAVRKLTRQYIRCELFKSYEPNRRYLAQFGVERAPALVVVHSDGTYHALTGLMSPVDIVRFLEEAGGPGAQPVRNPYIARRAEYHWHRSAESAYAAAEETGKPVLFVLHRGLSRDWGRLKKMLNRPEVYSRFSEMVHCRLSSLGPSAKREAERLEVGRWPALVIVHGDGSYYPLELPTSYEQVVRFADRYGSPSAKALEGAATAGAAP